MTKKKGQPSQKSTKKNTNLSRGTWTSHKIEMGSCALEE